MPRAVNSCAPGVRFVPKNAFRLSRISLLLEMPLGVSGAVSPLERPRPGRAPAQVHIEVSCDLAVPLDDARPEQRQDARARGGDRAGQSQSRRGRPRPRSGVTNHTCRRTFASLLYEAGASPAYVMAQLGHTSSALALEVYAKKMERQRDTGARMDALIRAADWAQAGTNSTVVVDSLPVASTAGRS